MTTLNTRKFKSGMNPLKLLIITNNPSRPSYRERIQNYLPYLQEQGIICRTIQLPKSKLRRFQLFKSARNFNAVLLHKKCLNFFDAKILRRYAAKIIYDFDDAVMYSPQKPESDRSSHFRLFERTVRMADCVIAGNAYLAEHARRFCSQVYILPTGLDIAAYKNDIRRPKKDNCLRLVWIGSKSTLKYLRQIADDLTEVAVVDNRLTIRVIADDFPEIRQIPMEKHSWSLQNQANDLLECDIGLAPLSDDRFTRGKCGFKILQYFAAGLPVIASPVGVNEELIRNSGAGLLASCPEYWKDAIKTLAQSPEKREQMGQKARQYVQQYDINVLAERFYQIVLAECVKSHG